MSTVIETMLRAGKDIFVAWAVIFALLVLPALVDKMIL